MKELRTAIINSDPAGSDTHTLQGMPIVFDMPTVINDPAGSYTEIILSGALDETDLSDVRLLYNHDLNKVPLARTPKTMTLSVTPAGLMMRAELPDTEAANEVYTSVQRGDLSGMSFAFTVPTGGDSWDQNTRTRTIYKISKIYECSIVPFPAYPQTSVEARSLMIEAEDRQKKVDKAMNLIHDILGRS